MAQTNDSAIGKWARSLKKDRRVQQSPFHLIETIIRDEYVTKCGKYMDPKNNWRTMETGIDDPFQHDPVWGRRCWSCVISRKGQR